MMGDDPLLPITALMILWINLISDAIPGGAAYAFPLSLAVASVVALFATRYLGGLVAALMPAKASTALRPEAFVGQLGVAASRVTGHIGQVRLEAHDNRPSTVLSARTQMDIATPIPRGMAVLIVGYDAVTRVHTVTPATPEA